MINNQLKVKKMKKLQLLMLVISIITACTQTELIELTETETETEYSINDTSSSKTVDTTTLIILDTLFAKIIISNAKINSTCTHVQFNISITGGVKPYTIYDYTNKVYINDTIFEVERTGEYLQYSVKDSNNSVYVFDRCTTNKLNPFIPDDIFCDRVDSINQTIRLWCNTDFSQPQSALIPIEESFPQWSLDGVNWKLTAPKNRFANVPISEMYTVYKRDDHGCILSTTQDNIKDISNDKKYSNILIKGDQLIISMFN